MSRHALRIAALAVSILAAAVSPNPSLAQAIPIDFSAFYNSRLQNLHAGYPSGNLTLGGIPFYIPATGSNMWSANAAAGVNPRVIEILLDLPGIASVHTLINTLWGHTGPTSYAFIEFYGSAGAYYKKSLVGNDDIRDFYNGAWTNFINGNTTVRVVDLGANRLDKQHITLPSEFHTQVLTKIRVSDSGGASFQRIFLAGMTAITVANPVTISNFTISPNILVGGRPTKGTVTLAAAAPTSGGQVNLRGWDAAAATGPVVLIVPAGKTSISFTIRTLPVTAQKTLGITAWSANAVGPKGLVVNPINVKVLALSPDGAFTGDPIVGTIVLDYPAPAGGLTVNITSSNAKVKLPNGTNIDTVTIPAGAASATFSLNILAGATGSSSIKATAAGGTKTVAASLTLYTP